MDGTTIEGNDFYSQYLARVPGSPEANDRFGYALAVGHFQGGDYLGIAIGVPGEAIGSITAAGAVNIIYSPYSDPPVSPQI